MKVRHYTLNKYTKLIKFKKTGIQKIIYTVSDLFTETWEQLNLKTTTLIIQTKSFYSSINFNQMKYETEVDLMKCILT